MASNVRKSRSDRSVKALAHGPDIQHIAAPAKRRARAAAPAVSLDDPDAVRRRIEHLECVITTAPAEHIARRIALRDVVPPSDEHRTKGRRSPSRRPMHVEARSRHRSMGLLVQSVILAVVIAGVAGWLNQRFHFMGH